MRVPLPFVGPFDERVAKSISAETCVNWYPDIVKSHNTQMMTLKMRPCLKLNQALSVGPHRGGIIHDGLLYVVSNNGVYSITTSDVATLVGSLNTYSGFVGMASNGFDLLIVDGTDGYVWNGTNFDTIIDADFVNAVQCKFLHGYFIVNKPGTGEFYISGLYPNHANLVNGTGWTSTAFATAEVDPDDLLALEVDHQELWLFGEFTTEPFEDTGNALFPLEAQPGAFIEWGIVAKWSVAKGDNAVIWLAQNRNGGRQIVKSTTFSPVVISSSSLEERMTAYTTVDDAYAFVVKGADKHLFYVITFPTENETHVYDFATELWHSWESTNVGRFRVATHIYFNGKSYMGDAINGNLYTFDNLTDSDNGTSVVRSRKTAHSSSNQDLLFCSRMDFVIDVIRQPLTGQGSDPQMALYVSNDRGNTWGNAHTASIGALGVYGKLIPILQLGSYRDRVYELRISDPVRTDLISVYAEIEREK
jgi:hypothetical protein